ncbi:hypothetical protein C8F04DRAFT_1273364 [Mycena alexandri]|uniref:Uncharacterized protein n=1 Tax=Mycena alexandri TaxID=1745969 RepID=A0AAD6S9R7_9AGAR|nr:hypothetical protein C8F04DRAFT_1273364 [Mycena alexandri]
MSDDASAAFVADLQAARERRRQATNSRKRSRTDSSPTRGSDATENDFPSTPLPLSTSNVLVSRNVATSMHNHAKKQKLRPDQMIQVDTFMTDAQTIRETKLYIGMLGIQNDLQKIIASKPAYSVSVELKTNIQTYIAPVLLSPKLAAYKGSEPVQIVFNLIKKYRFDAPAGFENNPADAGKITTTIEDAFTQGRSKFKKLLFSSVRIVQDKKIIDLPADKHTSLFGLAQGFIKGSKCRINAGLCGRIALMRKIFLLYPGTNFWDKLDEHLALIRDSCDNAEDIDITFEDLVETDKELHGNVEIVYQGTDDIQEEIDTTIATAGMIDTAITVPGPSAIPAPSSGPSTDAGEEGGGEE